MTLGWPLQDCRVVHLVLLPFGSCRLSCVWFKAGVVPARQMDLEMK
jgi:hypothetical protein